MKVWMAPQAKRKNYYVFCAAAGTAGIVLTGILLAAAAGIWTAAADAYKAEISLFSCILITTAVIFLAVRLGNRLHKTAMMFIKDDRERLYVIDAAQTARYRRGFLSRAREIQKTIRRATRQIEENVLPEEAAEIQNVYHIKEGVRRCALVCKICLPSGAEVKRTYIISKGYGEEETLLRLLEKKKVWYKGLEGKVSKNPAGIRFSLAALALLILLCVCSHPYAGILPREMYYPCLGAASAALYVLIYFIIRHRRGEGE